MVNPIIAKFFQKDLTIGEKILWTGQPEPFIIFTKADIFLIPFSIFWFGFVLFAAIKDTSFIFSFPFIGLFFLIIGFYMSIGRFIFKVLKKKKTYYAFTDKRILVLSDFLGKNLQAAYINTLPVINKSANREGNGSIIFGAQNMQTATYNNTGMDFFTAGGGASVPAFYDIERVDAVYKMIIKLRNVNSSNENNK